MRELGELGTDFDHSQVKLANPRTILTNFGRVGALGCWGPTRILTFGRLCWRCAWRDEPRMRPRTRLCLQLRVVSRAASPEGRKVCHAVPWGVSCGKVELPLDHAGRKLQAPSQKAVAHVPEVGFTELGVGRTMVGAASLAPQSVFTLSTCASELCDATHATSACPSAKSRTPTTLKAIPTFLHSERGCSRVWSVMDEEPKMGKADTH